MSAPSRPALLSRIRPWVVALTLCVIYVTIILINSNGDPLALVLPRVPPSAENPEGKEGYDGQFTYAIAVDPAGSLEYLDIPAYRLQRILLPILARVLAFGQAPLIPWTMLIINLAALTAGVAFLERLLEAEGASRWYALTYGLSAGIFMSPRLSLTEALAYGLVITAIWLDRQKRPWPSAAAFALGGLAKEPALIFALAYMLWLAFERRWMDALRLTLIAWLPCVAWQVVLFLWLGQVGIGPGGGYRTPFELIPYMGFLRIYTTTGSLKVFLVFAALIVPLVIAPSIWGIVCTAHNIIRRVWHPYVFALLANAAVLAIVPFSTYREPLGILRVLPGLTVAMLLYSAHFRRRGMLLYSLLWIATFALVIVSG